jgi:23S rRNA pseudouridine1911/1915/1917 synthase
MSEQIVLSSEIPASLNGKRLDQAIAEMFPDYSRTRLKGWIEDGRVTLDGKPCSVPREKVLAGMAVSVRGELAEEQRFEGQDIALNIVYEDDHILVVNKPAGLVVHPGAGMPDGTLLNALLHYYPAIDQVPRAGIIHRLDKVFSPE